MSETQGPALIPYGRYLDSVGDRLGPRGYERRSDGPEGYDATVFHQRTLSLTKVGYVDYFAVVCRFDSLTKEKARAFSKACFRYGLDNKSLFPRGLGGTLVVFPVIVAEDAPETARRWVSSYAPKHWGAFELPAIVDLVTTRTTYNTSKPLWGRAYYSSFQDLVEECLVPEVGDRGRTPRGR